MTSEQSRVLLQVARCPNVVHPLPESHPCAEIVDVQSEVARGAFQLPEPWRGDIARAQLLFVSSNPSLNQKVLFIVTGEFGRTPRLEFRDGRIGRDHWPLAMSILISGGGMPMGQVIGETNSKGEQPVERRLDPHDILAAVYHHLGIDHTHHVLDPASRPIPLTRGEPIRELVS